MSGASNQSLPAKCAAAAPVTRASANRSMGKRLGSPWPRRRPGLPFRAAAPGGQRTPAGWRRSDKDNAGAIWEMYLDIDPYHREQIKEV